MSRSKGSLRTKIIAWSFVPTALILALVAWVTFIAYQQVTEDLAIERDQKLTRLLSGEFAAGLTEYTALLTEYAGLLGGLPRIAYAYEGDLVVQRDVLKRARSRFEVFDGGVLILSNRGSVVAAEPERPEILGQDWSNRSYFGHMVHSPGPVFSDVVTDGPGGVEVIVVAVPIRGDQGQFQGLMAGMFRLRATTISPFCHDMARLRVGEGGSAYLVDSNGRVIYHSDPDRIGDDFSRGAIVQQVLSGQAGALRTRNIEGQEIVASFAPVPGTPWGLVTEATWAALTRGTQGYQRFLLLLLVLGVVVPALVVAVGVRRITKPVTELIGAAQEVAGGNFGQTITAPTGDEIEELAEQFNLMAAELQESYAHLERRVADRTKELAALNAIAGTVSQSLDLDEILDDALDKTLQVMEIEAGGIYLLDVREPQSNDEEAGALAIAAQRGLSPQFVAEIDRLRAGEGFVGRVAQSGQPLVVRNVSTDPRLTRMMAREEGPRSLASVPLSSKGKVLGVLFAVTRGYREFTDQDVQLLTSIGHQIGMAVENARLFGQAEQRMGELEALYRADAELHRHLRLDEVLQALVDIAVDILRADKSSLMVWDDEREKLGVRVARGLSPETLAQMSFARGEGTVGHVAATGEPVIVEDARTDPRAAQHTTITEREGIHSFMQVPIKVGGEVFGVFSADYTQPRDFGDDEQRLFIALAQRAALAIDRAQLYEQSQELAVVEERGRLARDLHDAVTQTLFSASLIAEALPHIWEGDQVEGQQLLAEMRRLSRGALAEMRTLLLELRPAALVEADLGDLLRQLAEAVTGRTGVPVMVTVEGQNALPPDVHVALYRITQEALNNVVKHAHATRVAVGLRCPPSADGEEGGSIALRVSDDGCGFDPSCVPPDCLGLDIIRERAQAIGATLKIESQPGHGTQVMIVWKDEKR